ncbi:protein-tyrosine phosphatase-like protein [Mycena rebaudengoi]|nr:protein-tyrosine phosphatase-like protein [Mycena rebaudengoi]
MSFRFLKGRGASTAQPAIPTWLSTSQSSSHQKYAQGVLRQRENSRALIRSLHLQEQDPPSDIPLTLYNHYSVAASCHPDNRSKNRYSDVQPYDRTRVVVADVEGTQGYLNANWCLEQFGHKLWIGSQAPLPTTAHAFLSLILQPITLPASTLTDLPPGSQRTTRVRTVVQLTQNVENGRRKAHGYFPRDVGQSAIFSPDTGSSEPALRVTLLESVEIADACCIKSRVKISPVVPEDVVDEKYQVTFQHLLYTAWPDQGVPAAEDQGSLLAFISLVDATNRSELDDPDPPAIVGCSAGIGRTGTFIAISSLLRAHGVLPPAATPIPLTISNPLGSLPSALDSDLIAQEVDSLREQRPGAVQQASQLELIYTLLSTALKA